MADVGNSRLPPRAPTQLDIDWLRLNRRYDLGDLFARGIVGAIWLLCVAIIGLALHGSIHDLAGKKTQLDVNVVLQIGISAPWSSTSGSISNCGTEEREMKRERQRADALEAALMADRPPRPTQGDQ